MQFLSMPTISPTPVSTAVHRLQRRGRFIWPYRSWVFVAIFLALWTYALSAFAAPSQGTLTAQDERAARELVAAQLAAFAADDANKAFSFAAPSIQKVFKTPANFMAMVRAQYPVVYRPASVSYFKPEKNGDTVTMKVQMTDANGSPWLAIYTLQRLGLKDKNKVWRITGCIVTSNEGRTA